MGGFEAPSILTAFDEFRAEAIRKQSISMKRAKNTKRKIHHRATEVLSVMKCGRQPASFLWRAPEPGAGRRVEGARPILSSRCLCVSMVNLPALSQSEFR